MKNSIIRLIGLFALISGGVTLYRILSIAIYSPLSLSINAISEIIFAWVALYGGYQTIRFRTIGRKLLLTFFSYQLIRAILFISIYIFAVVLIITNPGIITLAQEPLTLQSIITPGYFIPCILALIFLLRKDVTNSFLSDNNYHHMKIVARTLSFVAPGLGRALVGNHWKGTILFFVYFAVVTGLDMSDAKSSLVPGTYWPLLGLFTNLFVKLFIWGRVLQNDWAFVSNALKDEEIVSQPAKVSSPEQSSV